MSHPMDNYCGRCRSVSCDGECGPTTEICNDCGKEKGRYKACECFVPLINRNRLRYEEALQRKAVGLFRAHEEGDVFAVNLCKLLADKGILTREETLKLFER